MKSIIWLFLAFSSFNCLANGSFSFIAGQYYFELNMGSIPNKYAPYEFYTESYLTNTVIWKLHFKSILRIELKENGETYESIKMSKYAEKAKIYTNPNKSLIAAAVGEHVFILSLNYNILKAYRNTYFKEWRNNEEIVVEVEDGSGGSKYGTSNYILNISKDFAKKLE